MSFAKSAFKRSVRLLALASSIWKEEAIRYLGIQDLTPARMKQAGLLIEELGKLKGAAMKFGQILALESRDFFPEPVVAILETLQNQAKFLDHAEVEAILWEELKEKRTLLQEIAYLPIAAASIGQVHRARYNDKGVAVKIQYPGILESFDSDLKILDSILSLLSPLVGKSDTDYTVMLDEIKSSFKKEADYTLEAQNTVRYKTLAQNLAYVRVPEVFLEVSSARVLTLSFEEGISLSQALKDKLLTPDLRRHYAELFLKLYLTEFCSWGFVQTDPNLGNFLLDLPRRDLVLLDFGATREFGVNFRHLYSKLVMASVREDRAACIDLSIELNLLDPRESNVAKDSLFELLKLSMRPFKASHFELNSNAYTQEMKALAIKLVRELKFSPPPKDLIFLHRKLGGIFQILRRLEVTLDLRAGLQAFEEQI